MHTFLANPMRIFSSVLFLVCAALQLSGCSTAGSRASAREEIPTRTYVVTGASSGIGRAVAQKLGAQGANVVLAARRTDLLEEVSSEVRSAGGTPLVVTTDVSKSDDIERLAQAAISRFGRIDVWINNAGVGAIGPFWDIPLSDYSKLVDVNLKGVIYGSQVALRQFRAQGSGTLVNIGSVDSEVPHAYQASYSATKAGVLSLGRALNEELRLTGSRNVMVATVMPWAVDTPFWNHTANYTGRVPGAPLMDDPQKVADAIVWISAHPKEELSVGWKAKAAYAGHHVMPDTTERFTGSMAQKYEMDAVTPAPHTDGALFQPMQSGRTVDGGMREHMKQEAAARKGTTQPRDTAQGMEGAARSGTQ